MISFVYTFESKLRAPNDAQVPCYNHLSFNSSFVCLDWREICDSKIDCIDESDEINCWQLEINECSDNEYRCHNGQCISQKFLRDNPLNPDCLDKTDESIFGPTTFSCSQDPSFRCEEYTCRPGSFNFHVVMVNILERWHKHLTMVVAIFFSMISVRQLWLVF
jgi:hypothetical protein